MFPRLTVMENLMMGAFLIFDRRGKEGAMEEVLGIFPRLKECSAKRGAVGRWTGSSR